MVTKDDGPGLRERKKRLTRATIAAAALQLSADRGLDNVTIEDIAEVAFFSPRTFSNYFLCKEEAVVAGGAQDWQVVLDAFAARPLGDPPLEALCQVVVDFIRSRTQEEQCAAMQQLVLVDQHESLVPYQMAQFAELERLLMEAVAARTGTQVHDDLYPGLVATAAMSAIKSAIRLWALSGYRSGQELTELIQVGFAQISAGLPCPREPELASE